MKEREEWKTERKREREKEREKERTKEREREKERDKNIIVIDKNKNCDWTNNCDKGKSSGF